jgi:LuxR family maltose regulon positive regulatory protein
VQGQFFLQEDPIIQDNQVFLERPQMDALLTKAVQSPLVYVTAGTGYGKTQAVYSFLRKQEAAVVWIRFSSLDNNEWHFWETLVQAVEVVSPEGAARLREMSFPVTQRQFERFAIFPRQTNGPFIKFMVVYDDFHLLRAKTVLTFLERSVNSLPLSVTSIIISRTEPAINTVNLFSKGLLSRITERDLRFSQEEMTGYFELLGIALSPAAASGLYGETGGWAFAIHLVGLSLKKGENAEGGRNSLRSDIFTLIEAELFSSISAGLRKYLIKLSLIDHLSLELLSELAEDRQVLEEMRGISSFIHFDIPSGTCQIHYLLLEYLREKQGELSEGEKKEVYIQAARWCSENLLKMDAVSYYEKAGAYDKFIDVVYTLPVALPNYTIDFLLELLDRAPREIYTTHASASVLHTRLLITRGRADEAVAEARRFIEQFQDLPPSPFKARALCGAYTNLGYSGMFTSPRTNIYNFAEFFAKAHEYFPLSERRITSPAVIATINSYACRVGSAEPGGPERYIEEISAAEPHIMAVLGGSAAGMADTARAELAFFRADTEAAEKFAYRALYKAQKWKEYEVESRAIFFLLRITLAQGNYSKLEEILKLLEDQLLWEEYENRFVFHDVIEGWFFAHIEETGKIASWLKNDFEEREFNSVMHGMEDQVRTKWLMAEQDYAAALSCMADQDTPYGLGAFLFGRLTMAILQAIGYYRTGELERAFKSLETAYFLSEPNALNMPFIEMGDSLRGLVGAALKAGTTAIPAPWLEVIRRGASAYGKKLSVTVEHFKRRREEAGPGLILSRRERAVLTGLSQGLTREEIAQEGGLTLNTVKALITALYNKLGAVNRADAIRKAAAMGIIRK